MVCREKDLNLMELLTTVNFYAPPRGRLAEDIEVPVEEFFLCGCTHVQLTRVTRDMLFH